ncbi:M23 family metallopeptidase [Prauserella muralis]|uniref:Peptidase M23 n=1 Tax=Prauserella muralis TaxID=588067 RepID=A0A2V4B7M5_9PSEU|nr:M23 family metallopeptidase [Prauserella muralis]PXY31385.1 peptidase M23 [Prauserella muralis]TWE14289.1 peptidase M23-like protein [Prauserella muralis]
MRLSRRLAALGAVAATTAAALLVGGAPQASAAPNFQMPFPCGYTATAATFSGHRPANSVDFQKSGITGDTVVASAAGTVTRVDSTAPGESYGKWIEISHGGGWTTRYAHLSVQSVSEGQQVGLGTKIGEAGATGGVTGPHLHYEQNHNGSTRKAVLNGRSVPYYGHTSFTSKNNCAGGGANPYTPKEVCGSGYSVIDRHALGRAGTVYLMYNSGNGNNCVVTLKSASLDTKTAASAFLEVKDGSRTTDSGQYTYYAGPVRKKAPGTCVQWGGSLGSQKYTSPFEHCG